MDNWKAIILLLASGQGILLSLALFSPSKNKDRSRVFLGLIIWVISLEILAAWGMEINYFASRHALPYYLLGSYLILPPSVYLFAKLNTHEDFHLQKKHIFLFLPAFLETVTETGFHIYYFATGHFFRLLDLKAWHFLTEITPILWMIVVLVLYGGKLLQYFHQIRETAVPHSSLHFIRLFSLYAFLVILTLFWAAGEFLQVNIYSVLNLILVAILFALGYTGYAKPSFFNVPKIINQHKQSDTNTYPQYNDQQEFKRLTSLLEERQLYTRPKLTLEDLAGELKLPPRYVSQLINTRHAANFSHFINTWRVQEVIRKMNDPAEQHKTLLALALESGFNSKSAFNLVFKAHTGQSPSQYLTLALAK